MEAVKLLNSEDLKTTESGGFSVEDWKQKAIDALCDDFNSPILISHLFEMVKYVFALHDGKEKISQHDLVELRESVNALVYNVLALQTIEENNNEKLDQTLQVLINLRNQARKSKNFQLSDEIRDQLLVKGIELKDGREGTSYILK